MVNPFALALAAALIDVTIGYPTRVARAIGTPTRWIIPWLGVLKVAATGWSGRAALALYLAPILVAAAALWQILPANPFGFVANALLISVFCGRQSLDARAKEAVRVWESEGPYEALAPVEALGAEENEARLALASAAAVAARFADEVAAPTVFILIFGLVGAAFCRAMSLAGRSCRERRETTDFARAVFALERWTMAPAARVGAALVVVASFAPSALRAVAAPSPRPTRPAELAMLAALGPCERDDPAYLRRALALFRRAGALELVILAAAALVWAVAL